MAAMGYTPPVVRHGGPAGGDRGGRSGRNLPAAIGVGCALGGVIVASLLLYRPAFAALVVSAVVLGIWELVRAVGVVEARPPLVPLLIGGVSMQVVAWFAGSEGLTLTFLLTALGVLVWRLADGRIGYLRDTSASIFITMYVPLLAGFAVLMTHEDDGAKRVILFMAAVVCNDVGGYAVGVFLGRHPMAPTVSPKKSWEGFTGSLLACAGIGTVLFHQFFDGPLWYGAVFGVAIAVTATLGDLCESMIKRDLGIKDMGNLLPGHGGIMERLDSLLPCAGISYLLLQALL